MNYQINLKLKFALAFITLILLQSTHLSAQAGGKAGRWEMLGSRLVKHGLDKDEILVTASEGLFDAIQFKIKRSGINMHKCVVHFGDGSTQDIEMKNNFKQGSESRVINLEGNNRVIRKVVLWYDTKNYRKNQALVELWGKNFK